MLLQQLLSSRVDLLSKVLQLCDPLLQLQQHSLQNNTQQGCEQLCQQALHVMQQSCVLLSSHEQTEAFSKTWAFALGTRQTIVTPVVAPPSFNTSNPQQRLTATEYTVPAHVTPAATKELLRKELHQGTWMHMHMHVFTDQTLGSVLPAPCSQTHQHIQSNATSTTHPANPSNTWGPCVSFNKHLFISTVVAWTPEQAPLTCASRQCSCSCTSCLSLSKGGSPDSSTLQRLMTALRTMRALGSMVVMLGKLRCTL